MTLFTKIKWKFQNGIWVPAHMEKIPFWDLRVHYESGHQVRMGFTQPPTRANLQKVMGDKWRELSEDAQDKTWDYMLILDFVPEEPWEGEILTFYGTIECSQKFLYKNE